MLAVWYVVVPIYIAHTLTYALSGRVRLPQGPSAEDKWQAEVPRG
jgi:hypothetical protein